MMSEAEFADFRAVLLCEHPNVSLYTFDGYFKTKNSNVMPPTSTPPHLTPPIQISLSVRNVLLRGCVLKNTSWVVGAVCFTGHETKLMKNQADTPSKRSSLEKQTNRQVLQIFAVQFLMCLLSAVAGTLWAQDAADSALGRGVGTLGLVLNGLDGVFIG
jgi:phospholipid-transporting ATPase